MGSKVLAEDTIRDIKRKTRKKYSAEEKIGILLEGLRGEVNVAKLRSEVKRRL
jgi:transposase